MFVLTIALGHPHLLHKSEKLDVDEGFYKPIGNYLFGWDVQKLDSFWSYLISNIVVLDINMLCFRMEDWIVS